MTKTMTRPPDTDGRRGVAAHPHYTLGTLVVLGVVGTLLAVGLGIAALMITAGRNSVDDALVGEKVDSLLAEASITPAGGAATDVIPELVPKAELPVAPAAEVNVATAPAMPPASGRTTPAIVEVSFEIVEGVQAIDPATGVEFETWGYRAVDGQDGVVAGTPGPVIRARVGDLLRFTLTNPASNTHPHNIDLHAVTGQGGGAADTTVAPGETKTIEARMLYPGFFMYHCAYDDVPAHIAHGMYGGILVDPEEPLPAAQHEWYLVQSEYYTTGTDAGLVELDRTALTDEDPTMVVFNGAKGALTGDNALQMQVGDRARLYFINAGLDLDSNFHPIGSHWDVVYPEAALLSEPIRGSQTTLVPAGGGTVVEMIGQVPSTIVLVDHALSRAFDKGAIGQVVVEGDENPEIFEAVTPAADVVEEQPAATAAPAGPAITILPGSSDPQPLGAADEFDPGESPGDYSENVLTVPVGTTVTWTNGDSVIHTVTAEDGSFDSGFLNEGDSWSHTFDEAGAFEYYCLPHPWMRARIVVE